MGGALVGGSEVLIALAGSAESVAVTGLATMLCAVGWQICVGICCCLGAPPLLLFLFGSRMTSFGFLA